MDHRYLERLLFERFFSITLVFLFTAIVFNSHYAITAQEPGKPTCRDMNDIGTNITFLAFLPCFEHGDDRGDELDRASSILEECDLLTRAAVSLAVERVNQNEDTLTNHTLSVASLSRVPDDNEQINNVS